MHCLMEYFSLLAYVPHKLIHRKDWKTLESSVTVKTSLASRAFLCVFRQKVHRFVFLQWLATWPKPSNGSSSGSCQCRLVEQQQQWTASRTSRKVVRRSRKWSGGQERRSGGQESPHHRQLFVQMHCACRQRSGNHPIVLVHEDQDVLFYSAISVPHIPVHLPTLALWTEHVDWWHLAAQYK